MAIAETDYLEQNNENKVEKVETTEATQKVEQSTETKTTSENKENQKNKNLKKVSELAQVYSVVTQGFFMMIVIAGIGFAIGKWGMKSEIWAAIYAVLGALIGLVIFISILWKLKIGGLGSDKHDKSKRDE